jgi:peptidoglycan/LPS O-acetylase OafA/YrhL
MPLVKVRHFWRDLRATAISSARTTMSRSPIPQVDWPAGAAVPTKALMAAPGRPKVAVDHARIPELDGIRAIAIWMVLLFHIFYGWVPVDHNFSPIPRFVMLVVAHGWLGVDLFFVLSGFLITGVLLDSKENTYYFRNFYARHFLRIMPLYFTVVFIFFIFVKHFRNFLILSTLFAANLAYMFNVRVPHGPAVLWSLAVEEHFYLIWPLLVYLLNRSKLAIVAVAIVVLTPVARGLAVAHGMPIDDTVYVYSWFRFDGLALGALVAVWIRSSYASPRNCFRLAGVLVGMAIAITIVGAPFGLLQTRSIVGTALRNTQALLPFVSFLLVTLAFQGIRLTAVLRSRLARLSGSLSYCLYLINFAIGDGYQSVVRHFGLRPDVVFGDLGAILARGVCIIVASFGIAMLSKKYLEDPFLRLKRFF